MTGFDDNGSMMGFPEMDQLILLESVRNLIQIFVVRCVHKRVGIVSANIKSHNRIL